MRIRLVILPAIIGVALVLVPRLANSDEPASLCELGRVDGATANAFACLACHDGTIGPAAHTRSPADAADRLGLTADPSLDPDGHPIDIDYQTSLERRPGMTPPAMLPAGVALPGGKVSCTSCHAAASTEPYRTSVSMQGSALCFACHADY